MMQLNRQVLLLLLLVVCSVGGIFTHYKASQPVSAGSIAEDINNNLQLHLEGVDDEATEALSSWKRGEGLSNSGTSFLILNGNEIIAWNDNHLIPSVESMLDDFQVKFVKYGAGEILLKRWKIDEEQVLVAIIPLHIQYKIANDYLTPYWNTNVFSNHHVSLLDPLSSQGYPIQIDQEIVFQVLPIAGLSQRVGLWNLLAVIFFTASIGALLYLLFLRIKSIAINYPAVGFLGLVASLTILRTGMIMLEFPVRYIDSDLFDPKFFASSEFNPSMGDLILNSVVLLVVCIYLFRNYYRFGILRYSLSNPVVSWLVSVVCVVFVLFGMLYPFVVIQTIYNNSAISLSIAESIQFDVLRIVALASVLLSWISAFLFMHVFVRVLMHEKNVWSIIIPVVIGSLVFISINRESGQVYFWSFLAGLTYLVIVISLKLSTSLGKFQYATFAYLFVAVLCLSWNGMFAIRHYEQQTSLRQQFRFANNFLLERDNFGEYLLHEAAQRISNDVFIQRTMASPLLGKEVIQQKINQVSLSGYFNRYHVDVFLYNALGEPLSPEDSVSFSKLINTYNTEAFRTEYDNVYWVTDPQGDFSRKYVVLIHLQKGETAVGFVVLELSLKRIIPENVYPELLVDNRFQQGYNTQAFSYAVVNDKKIQYNAGDVNYESLVNAHLEDPQLYSQGIIEENQLHVAAQDNSGRVAIVSTEVPTVIYQLADFSFQVVIGVALILLFLLVQGFLNYSRSRNIFLAVRIQLILNLAFFLPLIAVSVITLGLTTQSSQEQMNEDYLSKANRFREPVAFALEESKGDEAEIEGQFTTLTVLANVDANVFYPNGKLLASSQPLVFENQLLAPYINPAALKQIQLGDNVFVSTEQVGNLQFNVAYAALFSPDTGQRSGILAIPFFQSASSLEQMQINVLANILTIFTLIFIALLLISFLVTKWVTAPLHMITKIIGRVSLTRTNTPLTWQSDDEIGLMVKEYNQMLIKLNDSKQELERGQRERAWREIAQQVAHEIKNPLTPMKLTLQQLERSIQKDDQRSDKLDKAVSTLLSQVNTLDDIASSFSSFAKMPEPVITEVELVGLLSKTINLHMEGATIKLETSLTTAIILADEQLLGRILSNMILNGLQAARPDISPVIEIQLDKVDHYYRISIADNGRGIEPSLTDKIFLPHFTTKQSGSGLGLAIAKQGIEQLGGRISFKTSSQGTTFFIELRG
jgi:two-component system nitrogen regulation sensor histidine kinase NtrY